jgi:ribose transport system ATP-binding protein
METMVSVRHLSKTFGGVRALDDVSLDIAHGEVHGLVGENGSGKSTLIKILAGFHDPDPNGVLEVNGQRVKLPLHAGAYQKLGLSFVHQDLGLMPTLNVVENFRADKISTSRSWHIRWSREKRETEAALARFGLHLPVESAVASLSSVDRALLAIVRAVENLGSGTPSADGSGGGLLVLDEPTVFLPQSGKDQLLNVVRGIAASGSSVLFVTHDLDEALEISDRITVLRNGRVAGTVRRGEANKTKLVELIIGADLEVASYSRTSRNGDGANYVEVEGLSGEVVTSVTFDVGRGEVLGLTGLLGSGFDEVPYLMFGATRAHSGRLTVAGTEYDLTAMTPKRALEQARMALLPGDRQNDGAVLSLTAGDNMLFVVLDRYLRQLRLDKKAMRQDCRQLMTTYDIRPPEPEMLLQSFSGGNQQKVLLAKWLGIEPQVLLLHEPTQGVDVGARQQVFHVIKEAAARGCPVVCASSDHEQLATICDRVLIFSRGAVIGEVTGDGITKERLTHWCLTGND